ncbi:phage tail protein [Lactococcus petauri]|uniref:phage tail protein n=1 Tax=Lactococcus petauri TaxID=1940789 RepID=UPI001BCD4334|nr:tape measure protein [Lactococcus petauri]MBS4460535.1 tape measure protein [Lactococcus petauri]
MESYSVEAVLSAVDKNFTSTMNKADSSMGGLDKRSQNTNTSILDIAKGVGVFELVDSAVGLVRNSLDGAIDRFDTLNKYPVVMQALGYSASDVDKSMAKLNKGIDGLPTSLDEIVSNTQQLAISTGSLTKGTDTAIALNNAFLASGASTADASRGMQQYVQMLSKGTVDMQSWRTLQETMPIAMDKVAKSFKDQGVNSVSDLYDALQSGKITFDDFNSRLIKLNDGVGGFAELAKKNSAGIKTSFKNVKTAVVKGLENVLSAIDNGMKSAGLGSIAQNFDKLKTVVNQVFSAITKAIPPVISVIATFIKLIGNIINALKPFLPVLLPIITTWGAFMVQLKGVGAVVKTFNQVKSAITGVMSTMKILFAIMAANPITVFIGLIAALVAAFVYFYNTNEEFRNKVNQAWQSILDFIQPIVETISNFIQTVFGVLATWWSENQQTILSIVQTVWGVIQGVFEVVMIAIQAVVSLVLGQMQAGWEIWSNVISGIVQVAWALISNIFSGSLDNILAVVTFVIKQVQLVIDTVMNVIQGIIKTVWSLITGDWKGALDGINQIIGAFGKYITGTFDNVMGLAKDLIKNGIDTVKGIFESLSKINLLDIGKAIIDGFVKGLKSAWEAGMKFIGGIGDWIKKHKGPIRVDRKLLTPAGNAIMTGLNSGLTSGFRDVQSNVSGMGDMIANAINSDYSVDIGANVAAANRSISSQVSHDVNLNQGKQPAQINIRLGKQQFKAFVEDISQAQGWETATNNLY